MKNYLIFLYIFLIFAGFCVSASEIAQTSSQNKSPSGFLEHKTTQVTTTTRKSWGDKFSDSIFLCIIGAVLFVWSFPSLWFNERRAVQTSELISQGYKICRDLDQNEIKPEHNGKLVFLTGFAENAEPIKDSELGVTVEKALKMKRKVEMYQWKENVSSRKEKDYFGGGETTYNSYSYAKIWSDSAISSGDFKDQSHINPNMEKWIVKNESFPSKTSHIGVFELASHQVDQLSNFKVFPLEKEVKSQLPEVFTEKVLGLSPKDNISVSNNYIYIRTGENDYDNIGDLRISYEYVSEEDISLVSCQAENTFIPYDIKKKGLKEKDGETQAFLDKNEGNPAGDDQEPSNCCIECGKTCPCCCCCLCCGGIEKLCKAPATINWIYERKLTKKQLFEAKENENRIMTWLIRFGGFLMMVFGIYLFFSPVYEFLEILPLLSSVGKLVVFVFALLVSIPVTSLIIMLAWLFYRPIVALVFFSIIIVFAVTIATILSKANT